VSSELHTQLAGLGPQLPPPSSFAEQNELEVRSGSLEKDPEGLPKEETREFNLLRKLKAINGQEEEIMQMLLRSEEAWLGMVVGVQ
jgi:hypothetical protein